MWRWTTCGVCVCGGGQCVGCVFVEVDNVWGVCLSRWILCVGCVCVCRGGQCVSVGCCRGGQCVGCVFVEMTMCWLGVCLWRCRIGGGVLMRVHECALCMWGWGGGGEGQRGKGMGQTGTLPLPYVRMGAKRLCTRAPSFCRCTGLPSMTSARCTLSGASWHCRPRRWRLMPVRPVPVLSPLTCHFQTSHHPSCLTLRFLYHAVTPTSTFASTLF